MKKLIEDLSSIYWWLGVVVIGIIINLVSVYLKKQIDFIISAFSSKWKERVMKKNLEESILLQKLKSNERLFIVLNLQATEDQLRSVQNLIISILFFIFGTVLNDEKRLITLCFYASATVFFLNALYINRRGAKMSKLIYKNLNNTLKKE